jgi:hypothetical protein
MLLICKKGDHEKKADTALKSLCNIQEDLIKYVLSHNNVYSKLRMEGDIYKAISSTKELISLLENMNKGIRSMDNTLKQLELSLVAKALAEQKVVNPVVNLKDKEKSDEEQISIEGEKLAALEEKFFEKMAAIVKSRDQICRLAESTEASEEKQTLITEILTLKQYAKQQEILIDDLIKRSKNELKEMKLAKSEISFAEKYPAATKAISNTLFIISRIITLNPITSEEWKEMRRKEE